MGARDASAAWRGARECPLDGTLHRRASLRSPHAGHQELIVVGVFMPDRGDDGEPDRVLVQCLSGSRAPDPVAATGTRVAGDRLGAGSGATREHPPGLARQPSLELQVLIGAAFPVALAAT